MGSILIGHLPQGACLITVGLKGSFGPWVFLPESYHGSTVAVTKDKDASFQVKEGLQQISVAASRGP